MLLVAVACMSQGVLREEVSLHVERNYYLPGDEIFFAVYCTEAAEGIPSRISVLANIELINRQGELLSREKIRLKNGTGSGSIQIPMELSSGEHMIRSYTSWMRNFGPGSFHYTPVLIIHPAKKYTPREVGLEMQDSLPYQEIQRTKDQGVRIHGLKTAYHSRDTIAFELQPISNSGIPQTATISLSIARSESQFPYIFQNPENHFENDFRFMPDMQGIQLSGTVTRLGTGEPEANRNVLLSFIDTITEIYGVMSDSAGRFRFDLNGMAGRKDLIIQIPDQDQNLLISIDSDRSMEKIPDNAWISLYNDSLASRFREMLMEQQLSDAYGLSPARRDGSIPDSPMKKDHLPFYGESDHTIIMEDFVQLPVMEEVFRELGKRIFLVREEGKYKALILDLESNRIIGNHPYYFIDGVPFFDSEKLLGLDPSLIKSISIKSRKYFMGELVMDGIIDIRSKKGDAGLIDIPRSAVRQYFQGFQENSNPVTEYAPGTDRRIPYFKTTLLFEPRIETGTDRISDFQLIAPDSKGSYTIAIRGITTAGNPIQQDFMFRVK